MARPLLGAAGLLLAVAAAPALAAEGKIDRTSKIRVLKSDREKMTYGVRIAPQWEDGGALYVNLPEHLEISNGGAGILRWADSKKGQAARWTVADDGLSATLDAKSVSIPGSSVKGEIRVVGADRVEITMLIVNGSGRTFPAVKPLYCFQYKDLKGFPRWVGNFKHSYVLMGGEVTRLSEAPRKNMQSGVVAAGVVGCAGKERSGFADRAGGVIDKGVDAAVCAVTSTDGRRKMIFGWTPGRSVLSNAGIPCIHADPFYGELKPGQSRNVLGTVVFTEEPLEKAIPKLVAEGVGLPESKIDPARLKAIRERGTE